MKDYLRYHWWKYVGIALAFTLIWSGVFNAIARPDPDEEVDVLFIGTNLNTSALEAEIAAVLPDLSQQPIRSVRVDFSLTDVIPYYLLLSTRVIQYDIIIIEQLHLEENTGQHYFLPLNDQLQSHFPNAQPYCEEADGHTLAFGYVVPADSHFAAHYTGTSQCYLFISPESVNFDTLNRQGEPGNDAALKVAQYLMEVSGQ